jgi:hypothetical protein
MQNPDEDTEWNSVLRKKGIIPEKEFSEKELEDIVVRAAEDKIHKHHLEDKTMDELDELEDDEDERVLAEYRRKRIAEMQARADKAKYGAVLEITAIDYVKEVNQAGDGVWVVLHLYRQGIPLCAMINQYMEILARKFPAVKFIKSVSTTCIPNYPDKNLPTIFVYYENDLKTNIVGPLSFNGTNYKCDDLEWKLHRVGAVKSSLLNRDLTKDFETTANGTTLTRCEDQMIKNIRQGTLASSKYNDSDDDDDY